MDEPRRSSEPQEQEDQETDMPVVPAEAEQEDARTERMPLDPEQLPSEEGGTPSHRFGAAPKETPEDSRTCGLRVGLERPTSRADRFAVPLVAVIWT